MKPSRKPTEAFAVIKGAMVKVAVSANDREVRLGLPAPAAAASSAPASPPRHSGAYWDDHMVRRSVNGS